MKAFMHSFRHTSVLLIAVVGATGCGGSSASEQPDVVIEPVALARALADDRQAALAAYGGKLLELTGTVGEKIEPGGPNPTLGVAFAGIDDRLAFDADLSFVRFDPDDGAARAEFEGLAVGDRVTLWCRLEILDETASFFSLNGCRVRA